MKTTNIVSDSISSREVSENAIAMSMDDSSTVFLMDMLGKLYARPALAVLREYLSNAYDAHVAKGGKLPPIEISLPHGNSKLLSVRDYGNGISEDQFSTILSRYGKSTKRDSNEFIGGFGLGAKAGFALNDEFFMTSHQNGTGLRARFYKDAKNQGYVEIVERFQTPAPDGMLVEVKIPKANLGEFSDDNITTLLMAYSPETIHVSPARGKGTLSLLNPEQFAMLEFDGNVAGWVAKKPSVAIRGWDKRLQIVIGKVIYGIRFDDIYPDTDDSELERFGHYARNSLFTHAVNIPIGSVDLPSSREEIIMSERSLRTLRAAVTNYVRLVHAYHQSEINNLSYLSAMGKIAFLESEHYPGLKDFMWRGKKLGAELLSSSNAFVKVIRNKNSHKFYTTPISRFETAGSFMETVLPTASMSKANLVLAETEEEAREISRNLTQSVLSCIVNTVMPGKLTAKSFHASFIILTKDDPIYEMVSNFPVISRSVVEAEIGRAEQLRIQMAKALEEKRRKDEAEAEAKKAANARMLHSFFIHDPAVRYDTNQFVEREKPEEIFCNENIAEVKYYWSQEELFALNETSFSVEPAFPYYEPEENVYAVQKDPETGSHNHSSIYHQKLREFLNHFLLPGSRVILLNSNADLETFKAEHPEVRSGVKLVKAKVEYYLKDETSDIMTLRGIMTPNWRVSAQVPAQVMQFASVLNEEQEDQLHPNFMATVDALERVHRLRKNKQYITEIYLEAILVLFCDEVPAKPDVWGPHENMEEKYPLFFFGTTFTPKVIPELIDYINSKNA